jgi:hypothetical protein
LVKQCYATVQYSTRNCLLACPSGISEISESQCYTIQLCERETRKVMVKIVTLMLPYFNIRGYSRQEIRKTHDVDFMELLCNILER